MPLSTNIALEQIDAAIAEYKEVQIIPIADPERYEKSLVVNGRFASLIERLSSPSSYHAKNLHTLLAMHLHDKRGLPVNLYAAVLALRREYELGHAQSFTELVHADTFSSFIEMAIHLQEEGYKDAAAVIIGSVLEQHLRELCIKNQIQIETGGKPKKADTLNAELAGQQVYSKLDQKNATAWLGLRNEAAHGKYGNYTGQQVRLAIDAIQYFIARFPA